MFMRKFLLFIFVLVAANCVAQERGEAALPDSIENEVEAKLDMNLWD